MDNQPNQQINPTPPQTPIPQTAQTQPSQQQQSGPVPTERKGLKTTGGVITLIFGILSALTGVIQALASPFAGIIILGLGIFWIVTGILILKSSIPSESAKLLQRAGASAVAYVGILFFGAFFLPLFKFSAILLPLIFAVVIAVISSQYGKTSKNQQ